MTQSAALLAQFTANINQYPQLSRPMVIEVAKLTFDQYFATQSVTPTVQPTVSAKGKLTVSASGGKTKTIPTKWSQIITSKEYGVCAYPEFKEIHEAMKKATPGLNYFTACSNIRNQFENTPNWSAYLNWVRSKHPNPLELAKDPSPRKSKNAIATTAPIATIPQVPGMAAQMSGMMPQVPGIVPQVPGMMPQVPGMMPQVPGVVPQMPSMVPQVPSIVPQVPGMMPQVPSLATCALAHVGASAADDVEDDEGGEE